MPVVRRRDLAASTLIAVLVLLYLVFLAAGNFLTGDEMTCVTLLLSGAIIILYAGDQRSDWLTAILAVTVFATGTLALAVQPSTLLLTITIATTLILWSVQLAENVTFTAPDQEAHDDINPGNRSSAAPAAR